MSVHDQEPAILKAHHWEPLEGADRPLPAHLARLGEHPRTKVVDANTEQFQGPVQTLRGPVEGVPPGRAHERLAVHRLGPQTGAGRHQVVVADASRLFVQDGQIDDLRVARACCRELPPEAG